MASIRDIYGEQLDPIGGLEVSDEIILRARDLYMLRMHEVGCTYRHIGLFFGVDASTVCRHLQRLRALPDGAGE